MVIGKWGHRVIEGAFARRARRLSNYPMTQSPHYPIQGYTIIELMVVLALIVILASLAMVQYRRTITYSKEAVLRDDLTKLRDAIDQYYADKNEYPPTLSALASEGYMRDIPRDPITESASTWQEIPAEPDASNPIAAPGVFDVKSGSEATALDGSRYSEW
jgi:general secretion pathway protein G